jgi:hypothetical protein
MLDNLSLAANMTSSIPPAAKRTATGAPAFRVLLRIKSNRLSTPKVITNAVMAEAMAVIKSRRDSLDLMSMFFDDLATWIVSASN